MMKPTFLKAGNAEEPKSAVRVAGAANDVQAIAPAAEEISHADNWFQVSPFGRFPHRVGMQVFDRVAANRIAETFRSDKDKLARLWRGLPIYVGHPDLDPKTYTDHKKYGSIRALEVRVDGLYAQAKWSRAGRELVNDEQYDFPSPLWNMEPAPNEAGAFRPVELLSVGLTNRPNIATKPVGANTTADQNDAMKQKLISRFGLVPLAGADEVTEAQIEQALDAQHAAANEKPDLARELAAANEARAAAERFQGEETARAANERAARIADKLAAAAHAGRLTEAERPGWQRRFEADFAAADAALKQIVPAMNTRESMRTAHLAKRTGSEAIISRAARISAANEAVAARMKEVGSGTYGDAFSWVEKNKPELFQDMQTPGSDVVDTWKRRDN